MIAIRRSVLLCCAAALLTVACARDQGPGLEQARFIDVVVQLRRATQETRESGGFEARKQQILSDARVTEEQLRAYIQAHARDFEHMAAVWESINVRMADAVEME